MKKLAVIMKYIPALILACVILLGFGSICFEFGRRVVSRESLSQNTGTISYRTDYSEEFPFEAAEEASQKSSSEENSDSAGLISKILGKYKQKVSALENSLKNTKYYILGYYKYIELSGLVNKVTLQDLFSGNTKVVSLTNGRVDWYQQDVVSEEENQTAAAVVADFSEWLEERGTDFFYLQIPAGICKYDSSLPIGVEDYANENYDAFCEALREENVEVADIREWIHEDNLEHASLFYKTDHHLNAAGALWAAERTTDYLLERGYDVNTDLLSSDLFQTKEWKYEFLGAEGRKVSAGYIEPETFRMIVPEYDTDYEVTISNLELILDGSFENVMYNMDALNTDSLYESSYYEAQLYGNQPLTIIHNKQNENGVSILLINNSMALGIAPYLSLAAEDIYMIDYRDDYNFKGSYRSFIEQYEPDLVILMTQPNMENLYKFTESGNLKEYSNAK